MLKKGMTKTGGRTKGTPNKKTKQKAEAMKRVLEQECRRELGIAVNTETVLDYGKRANVIKLMYLQGSGLITQDEQFKDRKLDVRALGEIYSRIEAPKKYIQTEMINQPIPDKIEVIIKRKGDYDRDKDPEVTNYGPAKTKH